MSTLRRVTAGLVGAAAMIALITVVSRVLGFARTLVFAKTVGFESVATAYTVANTLPNVVFEVAAGGALAGALVPLLAGPLARGAREEVDAISSAMLGWVLVVLVPLAAVVVVAAQPLAGIWVRPGASRDLVAALLAVFAIQVPLYGLAVVLSGILQAQRRFFWPAFAPVLSSLVVICGYIAFSATAGGATNAPGALPSRAFGWLAWGTTAGVAAMSLPLLLPVLRSGVRLRPTLRFAPGVAARARSLAFAGVGALLAQQATILAVMWLATHFGDKSTYPVFVSMQQVYLLPYAVLAVPLATSTFPRLAGRAAVGDHREFARLSAATTRAVLVASGVGVAVLVAVAPAAAGVFVSIGVGDAAQIGAMGPALVWIAPGLLGMGLVFHVSRALYALERGRAAVLATALGWFTVALASALACLVLVPQGQDGPATLVALGAGTTVGLTVAGAALLVALRRAAGPGALAGFVRTLAVLLVGIAGGAVAGRWTVETSVRLVGESVAAWVLAALGGALLALVVVLGVTRLGDPGVYAAMRAPRAGTPVRRG